MEAREGMIAGVNVIGAEEPSNSTQVAAEPPVAAAPPVAPAPPAVASPASLGNKKRGRPRKYGPDGANTRAFTPMPISSRVPPATANFSAEENNQHHKMGLGNLGVFAGFPPGDNFKSHVIPVNAGEDVVMKIMSFSQLQPWGISIVAAIGSISKVTLREPDSSRGTLTYEGQFNIVSLSGCFTPTEIGGSKFNRKGAMNICFSGAGGRVFGGLLGGALIAASPVQVVLGSFLPNNHHGLKPKEQKMESKAAATTPSSAATFHTPNAEKDGFRAKEQQNSTAQEPNYAPPSSSTNNRATFNITFQGEKPDETNQVPYFEVPQP